MGTLGAMITDFLPQQAQHLTEADSVAFVKKLRREPLITPLLAQAIPSSFVQAGSSESPILLLHGFDSSVLEFRRLLGLLAATHETWAVDLLGFGFTERLSGIAYGPAAIRTHLYHFWQTLIQRPVILVGASMGGAAALEFALTYPECVSKLVLIDSVGYTNGVPPFARYLFPPFDYLAVDILRGQKLRQRASELSYYNRALASKDAMLCGCLPTYIPGWHRSNIAFMKSGGYFLANERIGQIEQPTLILWGDHDQILDPQNALKFHQAISNSKVIWIKDCGHVPHLEYPQITAEHILNFCKTG